MRCCIADCRNPAAEPNEPLVCQGICSDHLKMASRPALRALAHAKRRVAALERSFADSDTFDRVWKRGRYLQFCGLIESAHDRCDRACRALEREITDGRYRLRIDAVRTKAANV